MPCLTTNPCTRRRVLAEQAAVGPLLQAGHPLAARCTLERPASTRDHAARGSADGDDPVPRGRAPPVVRVNWEHVPSGEEWAYWEPLALVPVPANEVRPLTGRRVVIHDPTMRGWNSDFVAASEPHEYRGATHVGILAATDWYRHRSDKTYLTVPRPIPIDRVWAETQVELPTDDQPDDAQVDQTGTPKHAGPAKRIVDASTPPVRRLRRALFETTVHGRRAAITAPDQPIWPMRACSEPYLAELPDLSAFNLTDDDDLTYPPTGPVVSLCTEAEWHLWAWTGHTPPLSPRSLYRVWLE